MRRRPAKNLMNGSTQWKMKWKQWKTTWDLVPAPTGVNIVGSKWTYKTKTDSDGKAALHKARLVAQGFSQKYGEDIFAGHLNDWTADVLYALCCSSTTVYYGFINPTTVYTLFVYIRERSFSSCNFAWSWRLEIYSLSVCRLTTFWVTSLITRPFLVPAKTINGGSFSPASETPRRTVALWLQPAPMILMERSPRRLNVVVDGMSKSTFVSSILTMALAGTL